MSQQDLPPGEPPSSVLLLAPGFGDGEADTCAELLAGPSGETTDVLVVSYAGDPAARVDHFREHVGTDPTTRAVLVGDVAGSSGSVEEFDAVETVNAPSDLTGLGIAVTEQLAEAGSGAAVCFDSVTAMLQYVDVETAYEFLHVIVGRLYSQGAIGHLHMDPSAHDDQTVARVASLVDGSVTVDADGAVEETRSSMRAWDA